MRNDIKFRQEIIAGKKALVGWCTIPSTITAEILALQDFDVVGVDLQHGLISYETALEMIQVIHGCRKEGICRVSGNDPAIIGKVLDAGYTGIICPLINNGIDAEKFVSACSYAPLGVRSFGAARAAMLYGSDYTQHANNFILKLAMIETREAVKNLDEILSTPGIDGIYIGVADLSLSMGYKASQAMEDIEVKNTVTLIGNKAMLANKVAGIHCGSAEIAREMLSMNFGFAALMTDLRIYSKALKNEISNVRKN